MSNKQTWTCYEDVLEDVRMVSTPEAAAARARAFRAHTAIRPLVQVNKDWGQGRIVRTRQPDNESTDLACDPCGSSSHETGAASTFHEEEDDCVAQDVKNDNKPPGKSPVGRAARFMSYEDNKSGVQEEVRQVGIPQNYNDQANTQSYERLSQTSSSTSSSPIVIDLRGYDTSDEDCVFFDCFGTNLLSKITSSNHTRSKLVSNTANLDVTESMVNEGEDVSVVGDAAVVSAGSSKSYAGHGGRFFDYQSHVADVQEKVHQCDIKKGSAPTDCEVQLFDSDEVQLLDSDEVQLLDSDEVQLLDSDEVQLLDSDEVQLLDSDEVQLLDSCSSSSGPPFIDQSEVRDTSPELDWYYSKSSRTFASHTKYLPLSVVALVDKKTSLRRCTKFSRGETEPSSAQYGINVKTHCKLPLGHAGRCFENKNMQEQVPGRCLAPVGRARRLFAYESQIIDAQKEIQQLEIKECEEHPFKSNFPPVIDLGSDSDKEEFLESASSLNFTLSQNPTSCSESLEPSVSKTTTKYFNTPAGHDSEDSFVTWTKPSSVKYDMHTITSRTSMGCTRRLFEYDHHKIGMDTMTSKEFIRRQYEEQFFSPSRNLRLTASCSTYVPPDLGPPFDINSLVPVPTDLYRDKNEPSLAKYDINIQKPYKLPMGRANKCFDGASQVVDVKGEVQKADTHRMGLKPCWAIIDSDDDREVELLEPGSSSSKNLNTSYRSNTLPTSAQHGTIRLPRVLPSVGRGFPFFDTRAQVPGAQREMHQVGKKRMSTSKVITKNLEEQNSPQKDFRDE